MYLAFGHDEEVGGDLGAGVMAALLKSRGVTLDMILDEGGPILVDGLPSLLRTPAQIALVGTAEKVFAAPPLSPLWMEQVPLVISGDRLKSDCVVEYAGHVAELIPRAL